MSEQRPAPGWDAAQEILCVRLGTAGDLLMTTPAIRALRVGNSEARITLLTSPAAAPAARLLPFVDRVMEHAAPRVARSLSLISSVADRRLVEELRAGRFDAAVIFTASGQSPLPAALATCLADIPLRLAHCRENPDRLLTDWVPDPEADMPARHEVTRQLALVESVGFAADGAYLSLRVPPAAAQRVRTMLTELGIDGERWLVVHPGASAPLPPRRDPAESLAAAIRSLARDHGRRVVLAGGPDEVPLTARIARLAGAGTARAGNGNARAGARDAVVDLAGQLDLGQLAALVARAPALVACETGVANDTGVAHVAAAVGTPVVVVDARPRPEQAPWGVPSRVLVDDERGVEPARLVAAVDEVVADWRAWRGILDPPIRPGFPAVEGPAPRTARQAHA